MEDSAASEMTGSVREATLLRLRIWDEAGPELEAQRWKELRALTPERAREQTRALLARPQVFRPARLTSGLVQQQSLFQRLFRE